jgi:hypothetical protein
MRKNLPRKLSNISFCETNTLDECSLKLLKDSLGFYGRKRRELLAKEVLIDSCLETGYYEIRTAKSFVKSSDRAKARKLLSSAVSISANNDHIPFFDFIRFFSVGNKLVFYSNNTCFVFDGSVSDLVTSLIVLKLDLPKRLHKMVDSVLNTILLVYSYGYQQSF